MSVFLLQVCKAQVKSGGDGIPSGAVWPGGKLEGVKRGREPEVMCSFTSLSKHFVIIGVSAMGW